MQLKDDISFKKRLWLFFVYLLKQPYREIRYLFNGLIQIPSKTKQIKQYEGSGNNGGDNREHFIFVAKNTHNANQQSGRK